MNKILFKLIEGKGKFFLVRNWPQYELRAIHEEKLEACISEALKNGEIVNPEVIAANMGLQYGLGRPLEDGDTFNLPEGMGFERRHDGLFAFHLLPEKSAQKEESQEELWTEIIAKTTLKPTYWPDELSWILKRFTIKRKEG